MDVSKLEWTDIEVTDKKKHASWIFFLRQLFTCGSVVLNFFIYGLFMGAPTVIIPQLRKEANSTEVVSPEMASWLSSMPAYIGIPWGFLLPMLAYRFGRKSILILISVSTLIGNIIFYFSTSLLELLISQAIIGTLAASVITSPIMIMSEYTSPKHRGVLLAIKSATFYWGVWISNAIGTYYHWRNIGLVIFVFSIYSLSCVFNKESPYWLATNGRFDECSKVHRWLKGTDMDSEEELRTLILSQQERLRNKTVHTGLMKNIKLFKFFRVLRDESFYKPFIYSMLPTCLLYFTGKMAYTVYAIDIIKKMTSSEGTAYGGMLILDAVTVLGMYIGCGLTKFIKRRKQLLLFSCIGTTFLFALSIYLYLVKLSVLSENKYVSLFLLTTFSLSISCGPVILSAACSAELCTLRYRSYFVCCLSLLTNLLLSSVVKFSPLLFKHLGTHGAFLFYAILSSLIFILVYKHMPETKDQTIQEIQDRIGGKKNSHSTEIISPESLPLKASMPAYIGIPWGFLLPMLAYRFGRKSILILISVSTLIGNIVFYFSTSMLELLISQAIIGILAASVITAPVMIMSEYTSPKHRGVLLAIKSATFYWGIWISNAVGTYYHWRNIGIIIFVFSIYNLSCVFYKESPYWLATNGRFDECSKVHRWLKGTDMDSEEELRKLIVSQQERLRNKKVNTGLMKNIKPFKFFRVLRDESFYRPFIYSMLPTCLLYLSGKIAYTVYAVDIIKKMTSSEGTAYGGMLILDAVTVLGMYVGCGLSKFIKRRKQLLSFSCLGTTFLFALSIYLYLVKLSVLSENKYVSLFLLTAFSISISCGPVILSAGCAAELCTLRYRSYFLCCLSFLNNLLISSVVKFSPLLFKHLGTHGAFLFYAILSSIFFILVYKYMPETKDRTIQEIQERIAEKRNSHSTERVSPETIPLQGPE